MDPGVAKCGVETLNAARRWARARGVLRRTLDSKTAPKTNVDKAKRAYEKTNADLEITVDKFEKAMRAAGPTVPMGKARAAAASFPWRKVFGVISDVAKAVETTVDAPSQAPPQVIDATPPDRK